MDDKIRLELELAVDQFNKGLKKVNGRFDEFSKGFQGQSKNNSIAWGSFVGNIAAIGTAAAIRAIGDISSALFSLGAESVQAASDAEETQNKFAVVFREVGKEADDMAKNLAKNYGLARTEAKSLLADTGDLLTGFGFTGDEALALSGDVQKLAVDLASFTNFSGGAKGASDALTKALLGERESVKSLGISIQEEDVKKEVAAMKTEGLTFATERQAKAQATLRIAMRQSQNAIGDFARSSDSYANQSRILESRITDLKESIGTVLMPVVLEVKKGFIGFFDSLDETQIQDFIKNGVIKIIDGLISIVDYINPVINGFQAFGMALVAVKDLGNTIMNALVALIFNRLKDINQLIADAIDFIPDFLIPDSWQGQIDELASGFQTTSDVMKTAMDDSIEATKEGAADMIESIKGIGAAYDENLLSKKTVDGLKERLTDVQKSVKESNKIENKETKTNNKIKQKEKKTHQNAQTKAEASYFDELFNNGKKFKSFEESTNKERVANQRATLSNISTLAQSNNKELAAIGKAAAITQATIDGFAAVQKALASSPPPFNFVLAGIVGAATAVNIANIAGVKFAEGGVVPGNSFAGDRVNAQLNSGEVVLNRPQQTELLQIARGGGSGNNEEVLSELRLLRSAIINQPVILVANDNEIARSTARGVQNGVVLTENV